MRVHRGYFRTLLLALLCSAGCNGVFYQPSKLMVSTPAKIDSPYEDIWMPTPDGEILHGWRLKPQKPHVGTVLHFHGNAENISTHFMFSAWLTQLGYEVIVFDYRGYGKSTGRADRDGVLADGRVAISWAAKRHPNFFILAQSLGGAIAVPAVALEAPPNLKLFVLDSTFASYRRIARSKLDEIWLTWPLQAPLSFLVSDHLAPKLFANRIESPTLFMHGNRDPVVPIDHGQELFASFGATERTFWTVENGQHTAALGRYRRTYRPLLAEEFCKRSDTKVLCRNNFSKWKNTNLKKAKG